MPKESERKRRTTGSTATPQWPFPTQLITGNINPPLTQNLGPSKTRIPAYADMMTEVGESPL